MSLFLMQVRSVGIWTWACRIHRGPLRGPKTEGFNNKIRWLIKQAYGYRDYKYFQLKVFDLPNLKPRDSDS